MKLNHQQSPTITWWLPLLGWQSPKPLMISDQWTFDQWRLAVIIIDRCYFLMANLLWSGNPWRTLISRFSRAAFLSTTPWKARNDPKPIANLCFAQDQETSTTHQLSESLLQKTNKQSLSFWSLFHIYSSNCYILQNCFPVVFKHPTELLLFVGSVADHLGRSFPRRKGGTHCHNRRTTHGFPTGSPLVPTPSLSPGTCFGSSPIARWMNEKQTLTVTSDRSTCK